MTAVAICVCFLRISLVIMISASAKRESKTNLPVEFKRLSENEVSRFCRHDELFEIWTDRRFSNAKRGLVQWECRSGEVCGGNGDRLRGIAGALYNAIRIGYDLSIRWDNPVESSHFLVPKYPPLKNNTDCFSNLTVKVFINFDHDNDHLNACTWSQHDNIIVKTNEIFRSNCMDEDDRLLRFFFNSTIHSSDEHWTRYPCLGCVFWFLFSISDELKRSIENELQAFRMWATANNRSHMKTIAIHFRGGDDHMKLQNAPPDHRMEFSHLHRMVECADRLAGNNEQPNIFLSSDSTEVKELAQQHYGHRMYISRILPFHTDKTTIDTYNGTLGSWTDIFLLALADGIVLSKSGFGVLAAQIGMYNRSQIIFANECMG